MIDKFINRSDYIFYSCKDNKDYFLLRGVKKAKLLPLLSSVDNFFSKKCSEISQKNNILIASKLDKRKNIFEAINGYKKYYELVGESYADLYIAGTGSEIELIKKLTDVKIFI